MTTTERIMWAAQVFLDVSLMLELMRLRKKAASSREKRTANSRRNDAG